MNKKGQFSIIAALLVAVVLISTVVVTYSMLRNSPIQDQPQVLSAVDEMNFAIKQILSFSVGYYGSILQVTGNMTYAKNLAVNYTRDGLERIADMHPEWGTSLNLTHLDLNTNWFTNSSYSGGRMDVTYSLTRLGISGINYEASCRLDVQTVNTNSTTKAYLNVTSDGNEPLISLGRSNFHFYAYTSSNMTWNLVNPDVEPTLQNGTYQIDTASLGIDSQHYIVQVEDQRGITVTAASFNRYVYNLTWSAPPSSSLLNETLAVELLQNGALRWLGQNLQNTTDLKPIPPIPVKAFHVNQTINGIAQEVPFQVEDWASSYKVPLGLTSNASIFSNKNMLVFLMNPKVSNITTIWWNGSDSAVQTPFAYDNKYFKNDNPQTGYLTNGQLNLTIAGGLVTSMVKNASAQASFLRFNNQIPTYGSGASYVIHHGVIRDIVQQEAEWSGGVANCPNVYSHMVLTLPANSTYYTYALRLIFTSAQARTITELSAVQLSTAWISGLRSLTENGTNSGYPTLAETTGNNTNLFYNFSSPSSGWAHHWSECINGSIGAGLMFTNDSNIGLYNPFDLMTDQRTGALNVTSAARTAWKTPVAVYNKCGESSGSDAINAIDNSTSTYWRHNNADLHWITLDMGITVNTSRVKIYQSSTSSYMWGGSSGINVYVSDNPNSWGSAVWSGVLNSSGWQSSGAFSAQGRYVKLSSNSTSSSQRLYEVQIAVEERQGWIEFNPVERFPASFTNPLDVGWVGAVVTFDSTTPIYNIADQKGLWMLVEYPPTVKVTTEN